MECDWGGRGLRYSDHLTHRQLTSDVFENCITTTTMPFVRELLKVPQQERFPPEADAYFPVRVDLGYDFIKRLTDRAVYLPDRLGADFEYNITKRCIKTDPSLQQYRALFDADIVYFVDNGKGSFANLGGSRADQPDYAVTFVLFYPGGVIGTECPQPILAVLDGLQVTDGAEVSSGKAPAYGQAQRAARSGSARLQHRPYPVTSSTGWRPGSVSQHRSGNFSLNNINIVHRTKGFLDWLVEVAAALHPSVEIRRPDFVSAIICREPAGAGSGWVAEFNLAAALSAPRT